MEIRKEKSESKLIISLEGRLDTVTAPLLETEINTSLTGVTELEFDLEKLAYISSAGLRVILCAQKLMNKQGSMKVKNVSRDIMDVFEITGFADMLTII